MGERVAASGNSGLPISWRVSSSAGIADETLDSIIARLTLLEQEVSHVRDVVVAAGG